MKLNLLQLLLILVFLRLPLARSSSLLGVSPQDDKYYNSGAELLNCKDGSKKINRSQLNDDFCDCLDASDEPGTSACPNGKFYCRNAGHMPLVLFSSRVNDGICDCCDGSDEYDGKVKCSNTCWEAGKVARDKLQKKIATYREGVIVRRKEIELAKVAFAKDEAKLSKLKDEERILKSLVKQLKDSKEQIEKQEEKERLEKEKEEKLKEAENDQDKRRDEIKTDGVKEEHVDSTSHDGMGTMKDSIEQSGEEGEPDISYGDESEVEGSSSNAVEPPAMEKNEERTIIPDSGSDHDMKDTEGLSKEELGRLVASRWTGEKADQQTGGADDVKDNDPPTGTVKDLPEEDCEGYGSESEYDDDHKYDENDVDDHKYDENDVDDHASDDFSAEDHGDSYDSDSDDETEDSVLGFPTWLGKIHNTVRTILQGFNLFQTPLNTTDAARVRKEYDESSAKLSKIESKISSLSEKLKLDFGPEKEFYSFYDRCFESKENKYVYKVCPFKKATQEEGHMTTRLGRWEKFEDSYKVMLFSNGDTCWNGPDRSMKVKLRCGLKNEVTDVDEPSRCEYVALLSTPSVCVEEKLRELQQKLDALNNQQLLDHDEL